MAFFRQYGRLTSLFALALSLLFLDFVTKAYVYHILSCCDGAPTHYGVGSLRIFQDFLGIDFSIHYTANTGAAWGLFSNFQIPLLILRMGVVAALLLYLFFGKYPKSFILPLVFIVTGALGNIIDFFLYGFVVDFLLFNLWGYHFPVFNFADVCITIGVIWLCLLQLTAGSKAKLTPHEHHHKSSKPQS